MQTLTAARNAMATRFEIVLHGENPVALRAAADQALQEIERLHAQLSLYLPSSEISFINARAARQPVQVEPRLFGLLHLAKQIHQETQGAFDVSIAPLIRCWGFMGGTGALPTPEQINEARDQVGMQHVVLDEKHRTIRFARPGMMLDLGSIGKGYALELAVELLLEAGVQSALIHGGTSTVYALGAPPEAEAWKIAIDPPPDPEAAATVLETQARPNTMSTTPLAVVALRNEALSVSGVHGKCFRTSGKTYGHVIDPRTGTPAQGALLSAVVLPSAAETDAFSTALLLEGVPGHDRVQGLRPGMRSLVVEQKAGERAVATEGIEVRALPNGSNYRPHPSE
jgi:FAD:protein FMN transferase